MYIPKNRLIHQGLIVGFLQMVAVAYLLQDWSALSDLRAWSFLAAFFYLSWIAQGMHMRFRRAIVAVLILNAGMSILFLVLAYLGLFPCPAPGYWSVAWICTGFTSLAALFTSGKGIIVVGNGFGFSLLIYAPELLDPILARDFVQIKRILYSLDKETWKSILGSSIFIGFIVWVLLFLGQRFLGAYHQRLPRNRRKTFRRY